MRHYKCTCGNVLFFDNSLCLQCGNAVAYDPADDVMVTLGEESAFKLCQNGLDHSVCNWALPKADEETLCQACRLNRTIPDLTIVGNQDAWHKLEIAKRRVLQTLRKLGLTIPSKTEDPEKGLAFDFLRPTPEVPVLTGHEDGVITLSLDEAEDVERERRREMLGEPYRTVVGHFRHEIAHYFWDRFFKGQPDDDAPLVAFREVFGDERQDYDAALAKHYQQGPPVDWALQYISAYASSHPWEDWAETWAHYLHIVEGTETAQSFGLNSDAVPIPYTPVPVEAITLPPELTISEEESELFFQRLYSWAKLSPALNEMAASLGHSALYPFVLSVPVVRRLFCVHVLIRTLTAPPPATADAPPPTPMAEPEPALATT